MIAYPLPTKKETAHIPKTSISKTYKPTLKSLDELYIKKDSHLEKLVTNTEFYRPNSKPKTYTPAKPTTITMQQFEKIAKQQIGKYKA